MSARAPAEADAQPVSVVEASDVYYSIEGRAVFSGLNVRVRRGSITAIMGPSGTGKTTLLRLIMGQIELQRGSLKVFGEKTIIGKEYDPTRLAMGW